MKNQHAISINNAIQRGVSYGAQAMCLVTLIACENVLPDYIGGDDLKTVYETIEKEMQRVWGETVDQGGKKHIDETVERLIGTVNGIRLKRGMEYIEW